MQAVKNRTVLEGKIIMVMQFSGKYQNIKRKNKRMQMQFATQGMEWKMECHNM